MKKTLKKGVIVCVVLALVLTFVYSGLQVLESTVLPPGQRELQIVSKTIRRDGKAYFPRQDIRVVMVLGIDRKGEVIASETPNNGGAVDMITLVVFDEKDETYTLLSLNRDTMLTMPMLNEHGREQGAFYGQLAYSHTYGTGVEDSCENTKKTVSAFLKGISIDYYVAMNMDAIAIMNDAVGGVTVMVEDDFTHTDASIPKGEVTLRGQQAVNFVQARMSIGDALNISRIRRQQEYMDNFLEQFVRSTEENDLFVLSVYDAVSPYIVTDCSPTILNDMMVRYGDYTLKEKVTPAGSNVEGEYMEYYVDEAALEDLVLRIFYAPK